MKHAAHITLLAITFAIVPYCILAYDPDAALERAVKLYDRKKYTHALRVLDTLLKKDPDNVEGINNRGLNKFGLGDHAGAMRDYAVALKFNPRYARAINNRGFVKFTTGDTTGAMADYELALSINPRLAKAYNNRGVAKFALQDPQGAIDDYTTALKYDPMLAEAYLNRGTAFYQLGKVSVANENYQQAINVDTAYAEAYFGRGVTRYAKKDKIGACSDWNRAFSMGFMKDALEINSICLPPEADDNPELNPADFSWVSRMKILTETGKSEIKPEYLEIIGKVAALLNAYPSMSVEIQGHADSINRSSDIELNRKLSQKRAEAVKEIIAGMGVGSHRMAAIGYGDSQPVESNETEEGREQNRRIVFLITRIEVSTK